MSGNLQIVLASRPKGRVIEENFRLVEAPVSRPGDGQLLVRNHWLSLDPYMRGRMDEAKSYARSLDLGEVMVGSTAGEVLESRHPGFEKGDWVAGNFGALGWQLYGVSDGRGLAKIDTAIAPAQRYLGVLGMPGVTAWIGLLDIAKPKPGETVVVSAAAGAVGSVVGQIAKIRGCRVVGIAGGKAKCDHVVSALGFDACVDYKAGRLDQDLQAAAPKGVDVLFENVGGEVLDAVLRRMNAFSRIALCGLISQYNATEPYGYRGLRALLVNRIRLQGFIVADHMELWPQAVRELTGWLQAGRIKYCETVAEGLENAPKAFIGMLRGENLGKQLVKLA